MVASAGPVPPGIEVQLWLLCVPVHWASPVGGFHTESVSLPAISRE